MDNSYTEAIDVFKGIIKEKTNHGIVVSSFGSDPFSNAPAKTRTFNHSYTDYSNYSVGQAVVITTYKTIRPDPNSDPMHPTTTSSVTTKIETVEQYAKRMLVESEQEKRDHEAKAMPSIYQKEE